MSGQEIKAYSFHACYQFICNLQK